MVKREQFIINKKHFKGSNFFSYEIAKGIEFKNAKLSLLSFNIYNQSPNITSNYKNNTFKIIWIDGTEYQFIIPDGYYNVNYLQSYIEFVCLQNNLYIIQDNGKPFYFITVSANYVLYSGQISILTIPNNTLATTLKYTIPDGANWTFPLNSTTPQIVLSEGLGKILGFSVSNLTIPSAIDDENVTKFSDVTPVLSPVYSYLITCNLINSSLSIFADIFFQVSLANVDYGRLLEYKNTFPQMLDVQPSTYRSIDIRIYDNDFNPVFIKDPDMTLIAIIEYE